MSKVFIDTNILVYCLDKRDESKQAKARQILREVTKTHLLVISAQVINEFYVVTTTKLKLDKAVIKNVVHRFRNMEVVNNDIELIEQAIDISVLARLSFWDSLIIAAAERASCKLVLSEDMNSGQTYNNSVTVINPFENAIL